MMDLAQLTAAALQCETRLQALELVRRETAATVSCFESIHEDQARTKVLGNIALLTAYRMTRYESARIMQLFQVTHPYFGGDVSKWPETEEEAFALGLKTGSARKEATS